MAAKSNIAKNYIYNVVYKILIMIVPLITTPYLSRVLGSEKIGIYSYTLSIVTYFILLGTLGINMYGQREIAYLQDNIEKRSKTFYEIIIMRFITLTISLFTFYLCFCLNGEYMTYYKILVLEIIANMLDISWFFQGLEEFKKTVFRNALVKIISTICIFLFIKNQNDLYIYFIIYVLSTFLGNLSLWFYLPKYTNKVNWKKLSIFRHLKPTIILFIPQIATQIYTVLDKTMIGLIVVDKSEVGYYEQAQKIIKFLLEFATSLGTVMMPRIAATFASGNKQKIKAYMNKSFKFIMMLTFPLMFGIISIANNFVPIFFGQGYDKVIPLICIISPIILLIGISNVIGIQYLLPTKQQGKYTTSIIAGALTNFILNCILIRKFASIGASIATVLAELSVTAVQLYLIRDEIKLLDILKISFKYIIAAIIMFTSSITIDYFIANNFVALITQVISSFIIYFVILILLKESLIKDIILKILKICKYKFIKMRKG